MSEYEFAKAQKEYKQMMLAMKVDYLQQTLEQYKENIKNRKLIKGCD